MTQSSWALKGITEVIWSNLFTFLTCSSYYIVSRRFMASIGRELRVEKMEIKVYKMTEVSQALCSGLKYISSQLLFHYNWQIWFLSFILDYWFSMVIGNECAEKYSKFHPGLPYGDSVASSKLAFPKLHSFLLLSWFV